MAWEFDKPILFIGFDHNDANKCMYSKFTKDFSVLIWVYIDDMLIFSTNMIEIIETKRYFTSIFKKKDLCEVDAILSIKVKKHSNGMHLIYIKKNLTSLSISI